MGGDWINDGLPHYVAIDRKPESGCEIQTACCGSSGIMMSLRIIKGEDIEGDDDHQHGLKVMLKLLDTWPSRGKIVCADSYFASIHACVALYERGWRFIGVIKTSHKNFPKAFLSTIELPTRGTCAGVLTRHVHEGHDMDLLAFVYCDKNRQYFISSYSNISAGTPIQRTRVRQVEEAATNLGPERVNIVMNVPKAAALYLLHSVWQD
jgi:Transposase IS4